MTDPVPFFARLLEKGSRSSCREGRGYVPRSPEARIRSGFVGVAGLPDLAPALRSAEERLGYPANPTLYTRAEFAKKLEPGHHFLRSIVEKEKDLHPRQ